MSKLTELDKNELGDLDFCRYLGFCDGVEDNQIEDYCVLNYRECLTYQNKSAGDLKRRRPL